MREGERFRKAYLWVTEGRWGCDRARGEDRRLGNDGFRWQCRAINVSRLWARLGGEVLRGWGWTGRLWFGIKRGSTRKVIMHRLEEVGEIAGLGKCSDKAGMVVGEGTDLWFSDPVLNVGDRASAVEINIFTLTDEEGGCGHDKGDGRGTWVVTCEPDCDGYVVGRAPEGDWEEAVETEEELGAAIVVGCGCDQ